MLRQPVGGIHWCTSTTRLELISAINVLPSGESNRLCAPTRTRTTMLRTWNRTDVLKNTRKVRVSPMVSPPGDRVQSETEVAELHETYVSTGMMAPDIGRVSVRHSRERSHSSLLPASPPLTRRLRAPHGSEFGQGPGTPENPRPAADRHSGGGTRRETSARLCAY